LDRGTGCGRPGMAGEAGQRPGECGMKEFRRAVRSMPFSWSLLGGFAVLAVIVGGGIVAIWAARRHWLAADGSTGGEGADPGDWEKSLVDYKNLRDEGVLSEEEFRRIRTLVEPRTRLGVPELRSRAWPPTDPAGPARKRT